MHTTPYQIQNDLTELNTCLIRFDCKARRCPPSRGCLGACGLWWAFPSERFVTHVMGNSPVTYVMFQVISVFHPWNPFFDCWVWGVMPK